MTQTITVRVHPNSITYVDFNGLDELEEYILKHDAVCHLVKVVTDGQEEYREETAVKQFKLYSSEGQVKLAINDESLVWNMFGCSLSGHHAQVELLDEFSNAVNLDERQRIYKDDFYKEKGLIETIEPPRYMSIDEAEKKLSEGYGYPIKIDVK